MTSAASTRDGTAEPAPGVTFSNGPNSALVRNAIIVAASAAGGQGIILLGMPLLSRLYSPADFGAFGTYAAVATALITIACLRYESAIPLPREEGDGLRLVVLSVLIAAVMALAIAAAVPLAREMVMSRTGSQMLGSWLWLLPVTVFAGAFYQVMALWCVRTSAFTTIARTKVTQGTSGLALLVGLGLMGATAAGLLIGDLLSRSAGSLQAARLVLAQYLKAPVSLAWPEMRRLAVTYARFPLVATVSSLVNVASIVVAPPLFAVLYGVETAGALFLAQRVVGAPVLLVSGAVSQVYFGAAARDRREEGSDARALFLFGARRLALLGGVVITVGVLTAPWAFPTLFGANWGEAGRFAQLLSISAGVGLVVSPLSQVVYVAERQSAQLVGDVLRLILCAGAILAAASMWGSPLAGVGAYTVASVVTYGGFFLFYYRLASSSGGTGE